MYSLPGLTVIWVEEGPVAPVTIYGMVKLAAEFMVKGASLAVPSIRTSSLRMSMGEVEKWWAQKGFNPLILDFPFATHRQNYASCW